MYSDEEVVAYEKRYVAFLDILGFREHVKGLASSTGKLGSLLEVLNRMYASGQYHTKALNRDLMLTQKLKATTFSDNIVISGTFDELQYVLLFAANLCSELLSQGYMARGAIALGDLYHSDHIVMGPALVSAYELESQVAIYPRLIIQDECLEHVRIESTTHPIVRDFDGMHYLDYLDHRLMGPKPLYNVVREEVVANLKNRSQKIRAKNAWMAGYLNRHAAALGLDSIEF